MQPDPEPATLPTRIDEAIDRSLDAYDALAALGEEIEDEWQYVQDLSAAWRVRLETTARARSGEDLPTDRAAAIVRLAEETARIADPHRAIDWLSTFPQAVLVALDERP